MNTKRNPGDTDISGKTLATERESARKVQAEHEAHGVNTNLRATIGRFWHSPRRWSWGFRFHPTGFTGRHDLDGVLFEVVEQM